MLSAGAAGPVGVDTDVLVADLDIHVLLDIRHDIAGYEGSLALARRVEGRDTHQTVDPHLTLQIAVCIFTVHLEGDGLDSRFVSVQQIQDLHGESLLVDPSGVHAVEHAAPVAGLGSARSGMEGHDRVIAVIGPGQERLDPHGFKCLHELLHVILHVGKDRFVIVFVGHVDQHERLFIEILQLRESLHAVLQGSQLFLHL